MSIFHAFKPQTDARDNALVFSAPALSFLAHLNERYHLNERCPFPVHKIKASASDINGRDGKQHYYYKFPFPFPNKRTVLCIPTNLRLTLEFIPPQNPRD